MKKFPNFPSTGKNSKVSISQGDGQLITQDMVIEPAYQHLEELYVDRVYRLGTGKTLINMNPRHRPEILFDGVVAGMDVTPGAVTSASTTLNISAGILELSGVLTSVDADTIEVTRPADTKWNWNLITVDASGDFQKHVSVDVNTEADLLMTYNSGGTAGNKKLIPATEILIAAVKVHDDGHVAIPATNVTFDDKEFASVDFQIVPNIGGILLATALAKVHNDGADNPVGRTPVFVGRYYPETSISPISSASDANLTMAAQEATAEDYATNYSEMRQGAWKATFKQLMSDPKVYNTMRRTGGHCAIRIVAPTGFGWQSVCTLKADFNMPVGGYMEMPVEASLAGWPEEVE